MIRNILSKYAMVIVILFFYQHTVAQEISSFTLINAQEDIEIGTLVQGDSIYFQDFDTEAFNIRVNVSSSVGSIIFRLDGAIVQVENAPPYALFGATDNDYNSWAPEAKTYTITASSYSLPQGQGSLLNTNSIRLTFVDQPNVAVIDPELLALVLVNADTDEDIAEIIEGSVFVLEEIGTSNLNIRAETNEDTESVVFDYQDATNYHTESLAPYAIGIDDAGDYRPWISDLGTNTVTATPFSEDAGRGHVGNSLTVNFEILEKAPAEITPFELRINSGGETVMLNDSIQFVADTLFIGSSKPFANNNIDDILETSQDSLYITERTTNGRQQTFGYAIPVEDGEYEIKLHFAEIYWGATGGGVGGEGQRVFDVTIEGEEVLTNYDMATESEPMTAIIKTFSAIISDGELNIDFGASVDQPKVAALEIYRIVPLDILDDCVWEERSSSVLIKENSQSIVVNEKLYTLSNTAIDSSNTVVMEIYDLETDNWSTGGSTPIQVKQAAAVTIDEEIWFIGGVESDSIATISDTVHIYNTETNTWSNGPSIPNPIHSSSAVYLNGKVHFFGGVLPDSTETSGHYVLSLNDSIVAWQEAAPLPSPRSHLGSIALNEQIYAIGGQQMQDSIMQTLNSFDLYDPISDTWIQKSSLPSPHSNLVSSIVIHENKVMIAGGRNGASNLDSVTEYDLETESWSVHCTLPFEIGNPTSTIFDDHLIVTNGNEVISIPLETEIEIPEEKELSVLVYHETKGFRHSSIEAGIEMVNTFGAELNWTVNESQTSDVFQADSLATYDVVIWLNTTGEELLTTEEQSAFESFIQAGGGFIGIHSATDTYRNGSWPWYNDLVGAIVQVNPYHTANNTNAIIDVVGEHPAIAHLETEWDKSEEYYYWERNGGYLYDGNVNLLQVRSTGPNSYDAARPVTWYKAYDGGRSFYTALGHNASDYESNETFRTMLKEAILWAAEEELAPIDDSEPDEELQETENSIIEVFPNPVLDFLYVNMELLPEEFTGEISIFGLDGILMASKAIDQNDNQIDLSPLTSGYYGANITIGTVTERYLIYKN